MIIYVQIARLFKQTFIELESHRFIYNHEYFIFQFESISPIV